jgi:hypothetical protein
MLVNVVFIFLFAIDAVISENAFELFGFLIVNIGVSAFITWQFFYSRANNEVITLWIRFISVCVFTPLNVILSIMVYRSFGWRMYKKLGADVELTHMYRTYQQMSSLIKVDLQFALNLVLASGFFVKTSLEIGIDIGALVIALLWAALGLVAIRMEHKPSLLLFLTTFILHPGYVVFKIWKTTTDYDKLFVPLIYSFGSLSILTRVLEFVWGLRIYFHFGKGLKVVFEKEEEKHPLLKEVTHRIGETLN